MDQKGILYIVATPIGNLEDITLRAIRILREVDMIAAEDTRHTRVLLNHYEIHKPLVSLHDHNENRKASALTAKLEEGLKLAYVSDAGTPGLSDPGYRLIRAAIDRNISVVPVPGASAVITALCASGLPIDRFLFQGFLPAKAVQRRQVLAQSAEERGTLVFYESPGRLPAALQDVADILGNRQVVICRELTKVFESFLRGPVDEIIPSLAGRRIKGEVTLLISGCPEKKQLWSDAEILGRVRQLQADPSVSRRDCIERIAAETGMPRSRVYRITVKS